MATQERREVVRHLLGGAALVILAVDFVKRDSFLDSFASLRDDEGCLPKLETWSASCFELH